MNSNERLLVYPYDHQITPILRHPELLSGYQICKLVTPSGWGIVGKDAGCVDGGSPLGIMVEENFAEALTECDTVWFTESSVYLDYETILGPKIQQAIELGKNVISTLPLKASIQEEIEKNCVKKGVSFVSYPEKKSETKLSAMTLLSIQTPVILVVGLSERANKFELQLNIREHFINKGYRVSQVGTRHYCDLMGFHSMPQFMLGGTGNWSETEKILLFNQMVKRIELEEEPDLIIIGVPGGTLPFNRKHNNRFGVLAFEISQAIEPDAVVYSLLYEDYNPEFFEKIAVSTKYRMGYEIDLFNLATQRVDLMESDYVSDLIYLTIDSNFIDQKKRQFSQVLDTPVYNTLNQEDGKRIPEALENILAEYAEVESF